MLPIIQAVHFSEMWIDNYHAAQPHEDSNIHFRIVHGVEGLNYENL
jgi:hypothetical protein